MQFWKSVFYERVQQTLLCKQIVPNSDCVCNKIAEKCKEKRP